MSTAIESKAKVPEKPGAPEGFMYTTEDGKCVQETRNVTLYQCFIDLGESKNQDIFAHDRSLEPALDEVDTSGMFSNAVMRETSVGGEYLLPFYGFYDDDETRAAIEKVLRSHFETYSIYWNVIPKAVEWKF